MKVPIKFRGKDIMFGRYIYGDLQHEGRLLLIIHDGYRETIQPDSVAQLVGYDKNGEEIYTGDTVAIEYKDEGFYKQYKAHLEGFATAADGCYLAPKQLKNSTLKD